MLPLLPHLPLVAHFSEPCAGDGALVDLLTKHGHLCEFAGDIEPQREDIYVSDARVFEGDGAPDYYITNPPWARHILHPIIENLSAQAPTWLLFDADWMHTKQAGPYLPWLRKIVSVGRVKWIPDSPHTGKDNCCWYLFDQRSEAPAVFVGRAAA